MANLDDGGLAFPLLENLGMSKRDLVSAMIAASIAQNDFLATSGSSEEELKDIALCVVHRAEMVADEWIRCRAKRMKGD